MSYFKDIVCVITGAGSGIGRATAIKLAAKGAIVIASDLHKDTIGETQNLIQAAGNSCKSFVVDVTDRDSVFDLAEQVIKDHGQADLILNNAGIANIASVEELTSETLKLIMDVDFWGVVNGTQAFLPHMRARDFGHIANVSSIFGWIGVPQQSAYNAAKFAVHGFTEALRQEMHETNIKVSCIHPGGVDTPIARNAELPQGQDDISRREEIAKNFKTMAKTTPDKAADTIIAGIEKGKARILIGRDAHMVDIIRRIFPVRYGQILGFNKAIEEQS